MEQNQAQPLPTQEVIELDQQNIVHDAEVIARTMDMIPAHSDLGKYLARPDTKLEKGSDGHIRAVDAEHSNYDGFKHGMAKAIDNVGQGKVGRVKLLAGMVNGHIDSHSHSSSPNLRYAFEQLAHFNITGNASFHSMLNKSGEVVGKLSLGGWDSEANESDADTLAAGAVKIKEGQPTVMFDGYNDRPDTKMYGMRDPETGELLENTFMLVKSGTFDDKDGTASNFSNMAFAEIVMLPDELLAKAKQPQASEVASVEQAKTEQTFDIDKVDWAPFQSNQFKVERTGGKIDEGGWTINKITERDGEYYAIIRGWDKALGGVQKTVLLKDLVRWQTSE